jgi:iron complex outermembrane receptor protein
MSSKYPMRALLLASVSVTGSLALAQHAQAQSIDYGSLEQLYGEPVTTSATGSPQKASEVPANMQIITQDQIRRSGADNLPDILQFATGIDLRRYGFASADIAVRGLNEPWNPRLLVLVDGRQVYSDDYDYVPWQALPVQLDEIRQIEIVKGPNSALFGFNAVSGVINIITYNPLYDTINTATVRTGTQSLREGDIVTTLHSDNVGVRFSAGGDLANEFYTTPKFANPVHAPEQGAVSADGKWQPVPGTVIGLSASNVYSASFGLNPNARLNDEYDHINSVRMNVSTDTRYGVLGLDAYRNENLFTSPQILPLPGQGATSVASDWDDVIYVVRATDLLRINDANTIRLGLEYRNNSLETGSFGLPRLGLVNGTIGETLYSGSTMWNWQVNPAIAVTNALRFDYLSLNRNGITGNNGWTNANYNGVTHLEPSFNSGVVYKVTDQDTIRLTAARGVQVPSLIDLGSTGSGNPNISPSIVMNYELGYDRDVPQLLSTFHGSLYYQTDDSLINRLGGPRQPAPTRSARLADNVGSATETGFEIGLTGKSDSGLRWNLSYNFASVSQNVTVNPAGSVATSPLLLSKGTPQHTIIAGAGYSWGKLEIDGAVRWQSQYDDFNAAFTNPIVKINNFITTSARIGYQVFNGVTVAVSGEQLATNSLIEAAGPPVERRIMVTGNVKF